MHRRSVQLRSSRETDDPALLALWERAHDGYVGYVPRSAAYWRWCVRDRPGVHADDVVVAEHDGDLLGYAVLGPGGDVLELALEPTAPARLRARTARALVGALERRSRARGDEVLRLRVPTPDVTVARALRREAFAGRPVGSLQWLALDPLTLVRRLLEHRGAEAPAIGARTFLLRIKPGRYRRPGPAALHVDLRPPVRVLPHAPSTRSPDVTIDTDYSTLTALVFRKVAFDAAVDDGRLRVHPVWARGAARALVGLLEIRRPWYTPLADAR